MKQPFLLLMLAIGSGNVAACSCPAWTVDERVQHADNIYMATLVEAKLIPGNSPHDKWVVVEGKFQIDRVFKGDIKPSIVTLGTPGTNASCGVFMFVGKKYIVYTDHENRGINNCSGTQSLDPTQVDDVAHKIAAAVRR